MKKENWIQIENASFNVDAVNKMSLKEFKETHKHINTNIEDTYYRITGKTPPVEKEEKKT